MQGKRMKMMGRDCFSLWAEAIYNLNVDLWSKMAIHCRTLLIWPLTGHTKLAVLTEVGRIKGLLVVINKETTYWTFIWARILKMAIDNNQVTVLSGRLRGGGSTEISTIYDI